MADEFIIKIEDGTGGVSGSPAIGASTTAASSTAKNIAGMAIGIGVIATFWSSIGPLFKSVLSLFKAIMTIIFIPFLPLIKEIAKKVAELIPAILKGQEEAGVLGGLGAIFEEAPMLAAGGAIASGFLIGAGGPKAKALGVAIGLGLSASLFGAALTEENWGIALLEILGSALIAGGVARFLFGGPALIPITGLVLLVELEIKFKLIERVTEGVKTFIDTAKNRIKGFLAGEYTFKEMFTGIDPGRLEEIRDNFRSTLIYGEDFFKSVRTEAKDAGFELNKYGFIIGSPTKGSWPIVYSLNQASMAWIEMKNISIEAINSIIVNLNRIPREIVTTHRIVTVRE